MKNVLKNYLFTLLSCLFMLSSCVKESTFFSEPYQEGKPALPVVFDRSQPPVPAQGSEGTLVKLKIAGLSEFRDKAVFKFNGQQAEIINVTDAEVEVRVPAYASTGVTSITIDDIVVFGPEFDVEGKVKIDPTWEAIQGTNNWVNNRLVLPDGKVIFVGSFTDYNRRGLVRPINRLVRTYSNGVYDVSWRTGLGANGSLNSITQIGDRYYIAGSFSGFDKKNESISNVTSLHLTGGLDSIGIKPFRRPDQADTTKYVPKFNGGFNSAVSKLYPDDDKLIATGNFRYYVSRRYDQPNQRETRDSVILDSIEIRHVARLNLDGTLDKTFRFSGNTPFAGGNGSVATLRHQTGALKGKIVVFGSFTTFDKVNVGYITRLNQNGTIDETFNTGGTGADYAISNVTFNEHTQKYMVIGQFKSFNGKPAQFMTLLHADGTVDESFRARSFVGGTANYAKQLNDGLIVVSGSFLTYDGITRTRFMILKSDGSLAASDLNATGQFAGSITKIEETTSEDGKRALLLMGNFNKFNNQDVSNLIRVIIE